jgi:hypothetical protein
MERLVHFFSRGEAELLSGGFIFPVFEKVRKDVNGNADDKTQYGPDHKGPYEPFQDPFQSLIPSV